MLFIAAVFICLSTLCTIPIPPATNVGFMFAAVGIALFIVAMVQA